MILSDFQVQLHVPDVESESSFAPDPDDLDSETAALIEVCSALASIEGVEFIVSGFGQKRWPVDVETDLAVFLEQLPEVMSWLRSPSGTTEIDFYEQGVERILYFFAVPGAVGIRCESKTQWRPNPSEIVMSREVVVTMLTDVRDNFIAAAKRFCPTISRDAMFRAWEEAVT
jgi:hypothetical protein